MDNFTFHGASTCLRHCSFNSPNTFISRSYFNVIKDICIRKFYFNYYIIVTKHVLQDVYNVMDQLWMILLAITVNKGLIM